MDIFLARQAIYDNRHKVVAYELLFRNSNLNRFVNNVDEDKATMKLISNCNTMGLGELTNNNKAFINFPQGTLLKDIASLLPKELVVIEILENVEPNDEVLKCLRQLKNKGYVLALDDVVLNDKIIKYGNLIDVYKIDFMNTTKEQRVVIVEIIKKINPKANLLAEKVETRDEFEEANKLSCTYYQGYYFSKPIMILGKDIPVRNISCFNIMIELLNDEFDIDKIEKIIKSDVAISYKLLKFLNSATFSFVQKINSIRQAIMLLGRNELKKWLALVVVSEMNSGIDDEVTNSTIIRGRFCELIEEHINPKKQSLAFMVGLFSNLDLYMNKEMKEILEELPIDEEVRLALLGNENELAKILKLVESYEKMNVIEIDSYSEKLKLDRNILSELYVNSIDWLNKLVANL